MVLRSATMPMGDYLVQYEIYYEIETVGDDRWYVWVYTLDGRRLKHLGPFGNYWFAHNQAFTYIEGLISDLG